MKVLIITVAGMSTRFSRSVGKPVIKCLYHNKSLKDSLLYILLERSREFDYFIIVGGYRYKELCETIRASFKKFSDRILLIENPYYSTYGSGYSLYLGLQKALKQGQMRSFLQKEIYILMKTITKGCVVPIKVWLLLIEIQS